MKITAFTPEHIEQLQTKVKERKAQLLIELIGAIELNLNSPKQLKTELERLNEEEMDLNRSGACVEHYKQTVLNNKSTAMKLKLTE